MPLKPLWDNLWGVTVFEAPKVRNGLHIPFERKKLHLLKVVEVGAHCVYVKPGDVVILPEHNGGAVVSIINNETQELDHRYCVPERSCLAVWQDEYYEYGEIDDGDT